MDLDFLQRLNDNIARMNSENGKVVVHEGKRIGAGRGASDNMIKKTVVSRNAKEATAQRRFEDSMLGKLTDELSEKEVNAVVDKYVNKLVDELFDGV